MSPPVPAQPAPPNAAPPPPGVCPNGAAPQLYRIGDGPVQYGCPAGAAVPYVICTNGVTPQVVYPNGGPPQYVCPAASSPVQPSPAPSLSPPAANPNPAAAPPAETANPGPPPSPVLDAAPRKLHIPIQVRNEAVQWLTVRGMTPPLLRATLRAYRALRAEKCGGRCSLSDEELLFEILRRAENLDESSPIPMPKRMVAL